MENYKSQEEKDAMEYMKSHGVRNISVIGEKTMSPLALIKFMDDTEEFIRFSNEEIQNMIGETNLLNWTYILNKSEKLKNKL